MGADIRHSRIRRAFDEHEESEPTSFFPEPGIGKLPRTKQQKADAKAPPVGGKSDSRILPGEKRRTLHPIESKLRQNGALILKALVRHGGYLPLGDHSSPEEIYRHLALSKRVFKQAIGHLWKLRKIEMLPGKGIQLPGNKIERPHPLSHRPHHKPNKR